MEDGIFEGLKVLDCASFIAAPAAATVLSDFGAEVIKIEPPDRATPIATCRICRDIRAASTITPG